MVLIRYLMGGNDSPARSSQYYSLRTFWDLTIDGSIGRGSTTEIAIDYPWSVSREVIVFLNSWTDVYPSVKLFLSFLEKPCGIPEYHGAQLYVKSLHKNFLPALGHTN